MASIKQINQTLEDSGSLKLIAQAYTEVSSARLQKIRKGIEKNRLFFNELSQVYHLVKAVAAKQHIFPTKRTKGVVCIVITSNSHFYGDIENRLLRFFTVNIAKNQVDRIVIGKAGQEFLKGINYAQPYQTITFKEDLPSLTELQNLSQITSEYQQILVYHSRFKTVLLQEPQITDITEIYSQAQANAPQPKINYIFEPEIHQTLHFFDNQIATLLLEQTFLESELARTGARLIAMEEAQNNADDLIKEQKMLLASAKRSLENSHLLEIINSVLSTHNDLYAK